MSTTDQEQKRTSRRLRRQRKGDTSGDSGSESDTIFEEASDYESAEEAESVEGTPKQHQEDDRQPGEQHESDYEEADEEEDGTAPDDSPEQVNDEDGGRLRISDDSIQARDKDEIGQPEDNEDEDGQVEGEENHRPLSEHDDEEEEEDKDEDTLEEKRESGDGQEEPAEEEVELDDDEDLKNPAYIPRKGAYYQHDVRNDDQKGDKRHRRERRLWKEDDNKWLHDKYDEAEQGPKSHYELMNYHGYDVRDPTQQDRGDNYRRGRGRGSRGGRGRGGRTGDVAARGRGRGRGKRLQLSTYDDEAGGDRREEESKSTGYRNSRTSKPRSRLEQDFPELPSKGEGDRRQTSESTVSYAETARGRQVEPEDDGMRIKYQKDKTYYEKDSGESYRNVTSDYRYRPAAHKSVNYQHRQNQQHRQPHHTESGSRERSDTREKEMTRDYSFSDSKQFYQLEFVNKNYQKESEDNVKSSKPQGDHENEKTFDRTAGQEPPEPSRKVYSSERHQRTRTPPPDSVPESSSQFTDERTRDYSRPPLNIHNLKIQVKGSERLVHYQESKDRRDDDDNVRYLENNNDEDGEEEQRMDKRERSRPKRYSSQRQRVQDPPTSHYYAEDLQSTSQSSARKPDSGGSQVAASERLSSHRGPGETSIGRQVPSAHSGQGLQSSLPPNNMMQQGMMMMSPDGQISTHGVRPPQLPSPAFFQQHQGNMPPAYFVGPMVNYGAPQYPMGAPLQFQHFSMGMPPSPQSGVAAAPPPPPPAPQSAAGSSSPSSSHNPSVQQVGGVTYYSPMQQPLQIRHPPPKRQSKPLTIESPPEVKLH